jgi:hypothetical protein
MKEIDLKKQNELSVMGYRGPKVSTNNYMPRPAEFLVTLLLNISCDILLFIFAKKRKNAKSENVNREGCKCIARS